jgi:putative flippase GtrA
VNRASRRFRNVIPEFARFAVVGAVGLVVTGGVFNLMIFAHQAAFAANPAAFRFWSYRRFVWLGQGPRSVVPGTGASQPVIGP